MPTVETVAEGSSTLVIPRGRSVSEGVVRVGRHRPRALVKHQGRQAIPEAAFSPARRTPAEPCPSPGHVHWVVWHIDCRATCAVA